MLRRHVRNASIIFLLFLAGCQAKAADTKSEKSSPAPIRLPVVQVEHSNLPMVVTIEGTVSAPPNQSVKVTPAIAGKLVDIKVVTGQSVEKGQVIARLDNRQAIDQFNQSNAAVQSAMAAVEQARTNLRVAQTNLTHQQLLYQAGLDNRLGQENLNKVPLELRPSVAAVEQARVTLRLAQDTLNRQQKLYQEKIAAKKDLIAAQSQVETAQTQLEAAQAQVTAVVPKKDLIAAEGQVQINLAQLNAAQSQVEQSRASRSQSLTQLGLTDLHSPISGVVANRFLNVGDNTDPAAPVVQVVNLASVVINANLPADKQTNIRVGMHADIRNAKNPGETLDGVVTAVSPIVDAQSNTMNVKISSPNPQNQLQENQNVTATITTDTHNNAIAVPQSALVANPDSPGGRMVYVVKEGKIERVKVTTGIESQNLVEIKSGLQGNETIVAKGAYGLPDGTAIEPVTK